MKPILLLFLLTIAPLIATTQEDELWIVNGKQLRFSDFPHITKILPEHKLPALGFENTSNYKGYTASWAVIDDQLYLVGIEAVLKGSKTLSYNSTVFKNAKFPVKVTQWSGTLTKPTRMTPLHPLKKLDEYDEITTIVFKNGKLLSSIFNKREAVKSQESFSK